VAIEPPVSFEQCAPPEEYLFAPRLFQKRQLFSRYSTHQEPPAQGLSSREAIMLAYAIIAFELAILYTVFWYVFLREPRPYRVQGNTWGGYAVPEDETARAAALQERQAHERAQSQQLMQNLSQVSRVHQQAVNQQAIYEEWNLEVPQSPGELIRSRTKGVYLSDQVDSASDQKRSTFARQFLTKLSDRLNRINVKIP